MKSVWQLKFPETASSRYIKKIEPQIHEEITHMHPNYYFSKPQRHHRYLWFAGHNVKIHMRCGTRSDKHKRMCILTVPWGYYDPMASLINNHRKDVDDVKR